MELVINSYGASLQKSGDCFKIKIEDKISEISCQKVSAILISTSAVITTDAIKLAMNNNIDIVFIDEYGNPFARVWYPKLGSTSLIRRKQLEISESEAGCRLALEWVMNKFNNQIELLKQLRQTRPHRSAEITSAIEQLQSIASELMKFTGSINEVRNEILGIEGTGARVYFDIISRLLPERFQFQGRSRNPAKDPFNALLNYAYGILYSRVEKACIIAGLDPYLGFLHSDNYNKKSLVFDLIENYRIWADEVVINLFAARKVKLEMFDKIPNGLTLNKEGKALLITEFNNFLDESIRYRGRNIQRKNIIQFDCHRLANKLIGKDDETK
ncbi:MAG: CRISPR-associated endonuclease Cas1 [Candidatus Kapaibacteriota bacterium]